MYSVGAGVKKITWLGFGVLVIFLNAAHADVSSMTSFERMLPQKNPAKLRQVKPEDMVAAPMPDDDPPPPAAGQNTGTTTNPATPGTAVVPVTGVPGIVVRPPLSNQSIIGLIVLAVLSLGSVWASIRLLQGEWANQATEA